ncbi:MAG: glutamate synthase subunit alpha, partial [Nitrospirae bacterium]|nr:glutamate synthase subunit alpha [Nitrospirota bacterium]
RMDMLKPHKAIDHWKARGIDLSRMLHMPDVSPKIATHCVQKQDHGLDGALDHQLIELAGPALASGEKVDVHLPIRNVHRTVGAILSGMIAKKYGPEGLPPDTIQFRFTGSAGQSFGAWCVKGVTLWLEGEANDYLGKGLSGGKIVVVPFRGSTFVPEETNLIGNVALYGATGGEAFFYGRAGERFAVRSSGATAVIEGVGDHGCEYMTGGTVVVLGRTGRNFAAGMSGGVAFVLNEEGDFERQCNLGMVELEPVIEPEDQTRLRSLIEDHLRYTGSSKAKRVLDQWEALLPKFIRVMPVEYKKVLEKRKSARKPVAASARVKG